MSYWDGTDRFLARNGGAAPTCPACGNRMFPLDDHGRFTCFCGGGSLDTRSNTRLHPDAPPKKESDSVEGDVQQE